MANWMYTLNIKREWQAARNGEMSPFELAQQVALRATRLRCYSSDSELQKIVKDFKDLDEESTFDEFDEVLEQLYDWGDIIASMIPLTRRCWIATSF